MKLGEDLCRRMCSRYGFVKKSSAACSTKTKTKTSPAPRTRTRRPSEFDRSGEESDKVWFYVEPYIGTGATSVPMLSQMVHAPRNSTDERITAIVHRRYPKFDVYKVRGGKLKRLTQSEIEDVKQGALGVVE